MSLLSFLNSPVTLAAAAVIAIGIIAYEIISHRQEERPLRRNGGGGPPRPPRPSGPPSPRPPRPSGPPSPRPPRPPGDGRSSRPSDTNPKGLDDSSSCVAVRENTERQVRHRKREGSKTEPYPKDKPSNHTVNCKAGSSKENTEFDEKVYAKNVFDKIENDLRNINQKDEVKKDFDKNIKDEEPGPSRNNTNTENVHETKLINTRMSNTNLPLSAHQNSQVSSGAESKDKGTNEAIDNQNCVGATAMNDPNNTVPDATKCMACEEVLANSVAHPCKHRYLCAECAVMVHRIYKKCTICESVVEFYQTS